MTKVTEKMVEVWAKMILEEGYSYKEIEVKTGGEFYTSLIHYHVTKYKKENIDESQTE